MASTEFPRHLIRKLEHENFPLVTLSAVHEARQYLDQVEGDALPKAREMGASADDIAEALGITRQGAYYKFKMLERHTEGDASSDPDEVLVIETQEAPTAT